MIVLITGETHTGKTALARRLMKRLGMPFFSEDHLKMGLIRSGHTDLTPEDDEALTEYLWPIVREIMKTAIENRQDLIVEGCYVPFGWRSGFEEAYLNEIRFVCLAMADAYVDAHFDDVLRHADDAERRLTDCNLTPERLKAGNRAYADGFRAAGERVVLIDGSYEDAMREAESCAEGRI